MHFLRCFRAPGAESKQDLPQSSLKIKLASCRAAMLAVLALSVSSVAQQQAPSPTEFYPSTTTVVTRDATAISLLAQVSKATGWSSATIPTDALVVGLIATGQNSLATQFTFKAKGLTATRLDRGGTSLIRNGNRATLVKPEGTTALAPNLAAALEAWTVPALSDISTWDLASTCLFYRGTEAVQNKLAIKIEIGCQRSTTVYWIDQETSVPVQLRYNLPSRSNPNSSLALTLQFSDFRSINGILTPFRITQLSNGRVLSLTQLNSVTFNVGLPDSDFSVPEVTQ